MNKLIVKEISARLDKFLAQKLNLSRSYVEKMFKKELVLVNKKKAKASQKLQVNDLVEYLFLPEEKLDLEAIDLNLDVVYEDQYLLVVNKAKGLSVHPDSYSIKNNEATLVNGLLFHCQDLSAINGIERPGIVHRIDKHTSGLLIIAKDDKTHSLLSKMIENKAVKRYYLALVEGNIANNYASIDAPIARCENHRTKFWVSSKNGRRAITHFSVIKRYKNYTLIECELETGRTHQIRVHMEYIKHPIVGDQKYNPKKYSLSGQLLHAYRLVFTHPITGQEIDLESDTHHEFNDFIKNLE